MESHLERTKRWMLHDVEVCMQNDAFIGAATLMMSHLSALAGYYAGRQANRPRSDAKEFIKFTNKYLVSFPRMTIKGQHLLYNDFRNGLIHEHLPKKGTALDNDDEKPIYYFEPNKHLHVLNLAKFYLEYIDAIGQYLDDVRQDNSAGVKKRFINRAKFLGAIELIV